MTELIVLSVSTLIEGLFYFVLARIMRRSADVHVYQIVGIICIVFAVLAFLAAFIP